MAGFVRTVVGRSVERRPIHRFLRAGTGTGCVLVLGGMHGDEPKGVDLATRFIDFLASSDDLATEVQWVVVPTVNPDGVARRTRRNARKVDINRNFPTRNWNPGPRRHRMYGGPSPSSEPETRTVIKLVDEHRPNVIITIHSIGRGRFCNNFDGPGKGLAESMQRANGYPVTPSIGYPTPGSFGAWAGREQKIAVVTLELPSTHSSLRCWKENQGALLSAGRIAVRRSRNRR